MIETGFGRVLAVEQRPLGSALDGDHTAGATTITVEDCAEFDDTYGGQLVIEATTYAYSGVDDEASTIIIDPALAADAEDTTQVTLLDPLTGATSTEWVAQVTVDGIDPGDSLEATVRSSLVDRLPEGLRGISGENVELQWDESGALWLVDILGQRLDARGGVVKFLNTDTFTGPGPHTLTHTPIDGSLHVYWTPLDWPRDLWTISGTTLTLDNSGGHIAADDVIQVAYAYDGAAISPSGYTPPTPTFGGTWRYSIFAGGDKIDRSAPDFDDSAWPTGEGPFGSGDYGVSWPVGVPDPVTTWTANSVLWIRTPLAYSETGWTIDVGVDNGAYVYLNGTEVGSGSAPADYTSFTVTIAPEDQDEGGNVLAIRGVDTGTPSHLGVTITATEES